MEMFCSKYGSSRKLIMTLGKSVIKQAYHWLSSKVKFWCLSEIEGRRKPCVLWLYWGDIGSRELDCDECSHWRICTAKGYGACSTERSHANLQSFFENMFEFKVNKWSRMISRRVGYSVKVSEWGHAVFQQVGMSTLQTTILGEALSSQDIRNWQYELCISMTSTLKFCFFYCHDHLRKTALAWGRFKL